MKYAQSLSLLTDLYELTMAYSYWKSGAGNKESVFHMTFRENPFQGGFTIMCGLEYLIDYLKNLKFDRSDLDYLDTLKGYDSKNLFDHEFLHYLESMKFECDIDAVPEGTVIFPHEPILRVRGSVIQCQIVESAILNMINFQSLIATKAARICIAAKDDPVLEFGLRRAQGFDGALAASRAAYIGGCAGTSNVLAGKMFGIPVKGTHAHSWVMTFDSEQEAFQAYALAMPNNCVMLVDTYNSLEGVKHAIETGKQLRQNGSNLYGIRLDSGDLAYLSKQARKILDDAGFENTKIFASNDLDEDIIASLKEQGAEITVWGVGTKLVTADKYPALGGVYKLSAIRNPGADWEYKLKLSEQAVKISTPGILQVRRFREKGENIADAIYQTETDLSKGCSIIDPFDITKHKLIPENTEYTDLLIPVFRNGQNIYPERNINEIRESTKTSLRSFYSGIKRFINPHRYPVGLEKSLNDLRMELIIKERKKSTNTGVKK